MLTLGNTGGRTNPASLDWSARLRRLGARSTGIALMGFGFVDARFDLFLRELTLAAGRPEPVGIGEAASESPRLARV
jgi:hypothetical protein